MTAALEGVSGQQHATATIYPRKCPVSLTQEDGWVPRPVWTDGKSLPTGIFFNLSAFIPVSIYNSYIVLVHQPTSTSEGSIARRTALCVIMETSI